MITRGGPVVSNLVRPVWLFGNPVAHSLSPKMHNFVYESLGLNGYYLACPIESEKKLAQAFQSLPVYGALGANITVPYKETAFLLVDEARGAAEKLGAVNTIEVRDDGKLIGWNTDGVGWLESVRRVPGATIQGRTAYVLGAGGASRSILWALIQEEVDSVILFNRSRERAERLALEVGSWSKVQVTVEDWSSFSFQKVRDHSLVVQTTSLGMEGQPPTPQSWFKGADRVEDCWVVDLVYKPIETEFLRSSSKLGCLTVSGLGMLIGQARAAMNIWWDTNIYWELCERAVAQD